MDIAEATRSLNMCTLRANKATATSWIRRHRNEHLGVAETQHHTMRQEYNLLGEKRDGFIVLFARNVFCMPVDNFGI